MARFKFTSRKPSNIPFPTLVSVILFYYKIWYIGTFETVKRPPSFGKQQLNMMRINFDEEGSDQSRAPSRSISSHARAQEAQSPPPQPSMHSELDARIKAIVDKAISDMSDKIEAEVGKLVSEVNKGNSDLVDVQEELKEKVDNLTGHFEDQAASISILMVSHVSLSDKMNKVLKLLSSASPSHEGSGSSFGSSTLVGPNFSIPKTEPAPSTSPSSTFTTPIISTSPVASSTLATVIIPPSHPSTVKLDSPPSTPLIDPLPEDSFSAPPLFGDDKGEEDH